MTLTTTTHLNFPGTARDALEFYQSVFGGQLSATTYGEAGMPAESPDAEKILFGRIQAENGFSVMAYDIPGRSEGFAPSIRREYGTTVTDSPFFVSLSGESLDELRTSWDRLSEGGEVIEQLAASAWSSGFGMLIDRFGICWTFDVSQAAH